MATIKNLWRWYGLFSVSILLFILSFKLHGLIDPFDTSLRGIAISIPICLAVWLITLQEKKIIERRKEIESELNACEEILDYFDRNRDNLDERGKKYLADMRKDLYKLISKHEEASKGISGLSMRRLDKIDTETTIMSICVEGFQNEFKF
ncbi:MAG: hypothetical protein SPH77_06115 [Campylobacter sp.]|uniref:hypothetical protein n=1 Tax=Campylobacter sp. TaxID=205 RepID=UPI002A55D59A|nr:hypothetical protein [Campylobacter sp.]MDD7090069.1 hypothetical protein [Campylobacteraceae bacterium]MCI6178482.1 hypothetical protein [Campylobacter sp.]MDY3245265.1 hypothetical protein [Campylobacter sp.]MDY5285288.1 hypothetical protein [Campylobacter sp.]MDY5384867.1 hypothetical protein [Campylobacter sp.]